MYCTVCRYLYIYEVLYYFINYFIVVQRSDTNLDLISFIMLPVICISIATLILKEIIHSS